MKIDIVIIGAGVIGLSIAHELLTRGIQVMLIDPHNPGRGASWASAGVLAPQGALPRHLPYLHLFLNSRDLFADYATRLFDETGLDIEYRTEGWLQVALDEEEAVTSSFYTSVPSDGSVRRNFFGLRSIKHKEDHDDAWQPTTVA